MWNEDDMNRHAAHLDLQETMVLRAIYEEGIQSLDGVKSFISNNLNDSDEDYIECIYAMVTNPERYYRLED